jgi:hypothetical protein
MPAGIEFAQGIEQAKVSTSHQVVKLNVRWQFSRYVRCHTPDER